MSASSDNLILSFQRGHQALQVTIDQIFGIIRLYPSAKQLLNQLEEQLGAHFQRQNKQFYETLSRGWAHDRQALKMIEFFVCDLKNLRIETVNFFEKQYSESVNIASRNLPIDYRHFANDLLNRIAAEKEYLLPLLIHFPDQV